MFIEKKVYSLVGLCLLFSFTLLTSCINSQDEIVEVEASPSPAGATTPFESSTAIPDPTATLLSPTTTATPSPTATLPPPPADGMIYFVWDSAPLFRGEIIDPMENLYAIATDSWQVEPLLDSSQRWPIGLSPLFLLEENKYIVTIWEDTDGNGFISEPLGNDFSNLYSYDLMSQSLTRFTTNSDLNIYNFSWSSDGKYITYPQQTMLITASLDGIVSPLGAESLPERNVTELAWSPDGQFLAIELQSQLLLFDKENSETDFLLAYQANNLASQLAWNAPSEWFITGYIGLWAIRPETKQIVQLVAPSLYSFAEWSPNGEAVAFTQYNQALNEDGLFLWEQETRNRRQLINNADYISSIMWSPTGRYLVASVEQEADRNLALVDVLSEERKNLLTVPSSSELEILAWSPDGEWVLFYLEEGESFGVYVVHVTGAGLEKVLDTTNTRAPYGFFWVPELVE